MTADQNANTNFTKHYLNVKSLTPASQPTTTSTASATTSNQASLSLSLTSTPVIIFFSLLIIGTIGLLITRARDLNKLLMVLAISLIASAIPLTTQILSQETRLTSHAGPEYTPKNVIVYNLTATSFMISWQTDKSDTGIIRVRTTPEVSPHTRIISDSPDQSEYMHHLTVDELEPNNSYYLEILSGGQWYNLNGQPLYIKTPPQ